ncbi:MAG TPA: GH3 auxin-responsive promoter family protein, partial [Balneolales bacterium]|nr:GH3 auxin-responsive promoter family protein [Balneolales bacterium]
REAPGWLTPFQVISPRELCRMNWKDKFSVCLHRAVKEDVRVITAVPSWTLIYLQEAIRLTYDKPIAEIWPNLKLIVSGGVALGNYRKAIEELCAPLPLRFIESYGASEGYFAFTRQLNKPELQLVTDNGIFYEWVPYEPGLDEVQLAKRSVPSWETETGQDYIMLVTTNSGLWRYPVNDILRFTNNNPLCLEVRGRVGEMFDDYGEAVRYSELNDILNRLAPAAGGSHIQLIVSVKPPDTRKPPHHIWLIIWTHKPPVDESRFARLMDERLSDLNRHYAIRRESGALGNPEVAFLDPDDQYTFLKEQENGRAQSKPVLTLPYSILKDMLEKHG